MTTYALNEAKMFADITDGIAIVINSETGIYYGANTLGTAVLDQFLKGASDESVAAALKKLPGCPADIDAKLADFAKALVEKELVIPGNAAKVEASFTADAIKDGWEMAINEFSDAQELLLADPIHEVKEETGWAPDTAALNTDKEDVARREAKLQ